MFNNFFLKVLKSATLTIVPNSECKEKLEYSFNQDLKERHPNAPHITIAMYPYILCATGQDTQSTTCKGDSGGI